MTSKSPSRRDQSDAAPESLTEPTGFSNIGTPANEPLIDTTQDQSNLDQACLSLLSSRVFSGLLPEEQLIADTSRAADHLARLLGKNESSDLELATQTLVERIAFASRGKRLHQCSGDLTRQISVITQAMLTGRCLSGQYNLRNRELHPYALVVKEPKVYLLATEHTEQTDEHDDVVIKQYLLNRFDSLEINNTPNKVPDDFNVNNYIDGGNMDLQVPTLKDTLGAQFELVLRINEHNNEALIRDLQDFTLTSQQKAFIKSDNNNYLLSVPNQAPTYALLEWLLGRMDRVEVLEPVELRRYLKEKLKVTFELYTQSPQAEHNEICDVSSSTQAQSASEETPEIEQKTVNQHSVRRSQYANNSPKNRLVAMLVMRILSNVWIDKDVLNHHAIWLINTLFDGQVRGYINDEDVDGFRKWVSTQSDLLQAEELDEQDPLLVNISEAAKLLCLNEVEINVLCLATMISTNSVFRSVLTLLNDRPTEYDGYEIISQLTYDSVEEIAAALNDKATLRKSGLIGRCPISILSMWDILKTPSVITSNLFELHDNAHGIISGLANSSPDTQLAKDDLEHVAQSLKVAQDYLEGASDKKAIGCNILLWGPPGTGKTELARYLCKSLTLNAMEISSVKSDGKALCELERMSTYMLMQTVLERADRSVIIFDEVENILDPPFSVKNEISKASLNEFLESNPVPAIWISNSVEDVDPAYLRRFDIVHEISVPEFAAKKRVAQRILNDVPLDEELLDAFLERQEVGPAFLKKVKRVVDLSGATTQEAVTNLATNLLDNEIAMSGGLPASLPDSASDNTATANLPYDFTLINASEDLNVLANTLNADMNIKFCLYGAPGTGKTAWAKKLAEQLHRPALVKQASDIKNAYVGVEEKIIANAFAQAEKESAVLIFDEVDTFLCSRTGDLKQHEISSINQFLTSLENYQGIVVCSTNLMDNLDKAALRRFDFKVKFNYLTAVQANQLLVSTASLLGMQVTPKDLVTHNCTLTGHIFAPGDFAVVLRRAQIRPKGEVTLEQLCADLKAEVAIRDGKFSTQTFGFS